MKSLIYIELTESVTSPYEKEIISWAKSQFTDISTFDLDNRSDALMFSYAESLAEKSDKLVIYITAEETANASKLIRLAEKTIGKKQNCLVIKKGSNSLLNRMFSLMNNAYKKGLTPKEEKKAIEDFFRE